MLYFISFIFTTNTYLVSTMLFCDCGGIILKSIGCNVCGKHGGDDMLCYKDMTFCSSSTCTNKECFRKYSEKVRQDSENFGLPLSLSDFSYDCNRYRREK